MCVNANIKSISFIVIIVAVLILLTFEIDLKSYKDDECIGVPICNSQHGLIGKVMCSLFQYPLNLDRKDYKKEVLNRVTRFAQRNLKGQRHVIEAVIKDISVKLENPDRPLVLHFAGDNGVGKTTLAQLISLALGLRCRDSTCSVGDSTLVLSGVSFDGYSVVEFRRDVVQKIVQHANSFPKNGVVIINDLGALHPDLVRVLLPLLGRASVFPEAPGIQLCRLTVIITTDFGRQGRTQGKSLIEMRRIVEDDFKSLYSHLSSSMIQTYPFLPTSLTTAKEIVRLTINDYKCKNKDIISEIYVSEDVIAWFIDLVRDDLPMENGRCVANAVTAIIGPIISKYLYEMPTSQISLRVDLNDDGLVTVIPTQ